MEDQGRQEQRVPTFFGRNLLQMGDAILECGEADLGMVSWRRTGELTQVRSFA